ncbi:tetratricopeptide repeat protein [Anaerotalea alkaliphila]|uniref:Tetratricopeptide repeat protein n=1 Tax=Anaerotalea alkaliphila TaxID=2662126 RepID=A0A7X5KP79_9FIRM|nr:tetratricopeptide repeat protein [Anaerotalea alkaliphila]NDL67667.1 tetratricopeptide repeat protein [Anaerotalea alkaliphila]
MARQWFLRRWTGTLLGLAGLFLQYGRKRPDRAMGFYGRALGMGTRHIPVLGSYGLLLLRGGSYAQAKEAFEQALANSKHFYVNKTMKANIALCLWKLGRVEEAVLAYEKLLYDMADLSRPVDWSPAEREHLLKENPYFTAQDFVSLGYLHLELGHLREARFHTEAALERSPDLSTAYDNLGQIHLAEGKGDQAKAAFEKALSLHPGQVDSLYHLARLRLGEGDLPGSRELAGRLLAVPMDGLNSITPEMARTLAEDVEKATP